MSAKAAWRAGVCLPALGSLRVASAAQLCGQDHQNSEELQHETDRRLIGGQDGYHTFRIPSIIVTQEGTVLAFCKSRSLQRVPG